MKPTQSIERTLILAASTEAVWNALTNPEKTRQFMFNCEVSSDWKPGSPITWKGNYQGYESGERGIILEIEKEKLLKYSSIDPNFGIAMTPENYLHIAYSLEPQEDGTRLTTKIDNFNDDPNRMGHIAKGWDEIVLPALQGMFNK